MAICGYATSSGPCERTVADENDSCFMHSGDGTPPGHGAPPGNQNAVENSGGGPPAGNANAAKYHGWSDPHLHYERLESNAKEHVDERTKLYVDQATADFPQDEIEEKAQLLATLGHQGWLSLFEIADSGLAVERTRKIDGEQFTYSVVNPAAEAKFRLHSKEWELRDELQLSDEDDSE